MRWNNILRTRKECHGPGPGGDANWLFIPKPGKKNIFNGCQKKGSGKKQHMVHDLNITKH